MEFVDFLDYEMVKSDLTIAKINKVNGELTFENRMLLFFLIALICIILLFAYLKLKEN